MWFILGALLTFSSWALAPYEQFPNVKILKIFPGNVVLLDRGLEDGILRNDHIKIGNETVGFAGRAICIRAQATVSYWKLYRVPYGDAFTMDLTYTVIGLADREIPSPVNKILNETQPVPDSPTRRAEKDPFAVNPDLPERLTERDLIEAAGPERQKLFIERALNEEQLRRDLSTYQVSLYASPYMRQSINGGESFRYGLRGGNVGTRYRLLTQFEQQRTRLKDPFTDASVQTKSTTGQVQFIIHKLSRNFSSLSLVNYNSAEFSAVGTPHSHWQFAPLGFTWHFHPSKSWEYVDLSYVPLYDIRITEQFMASGIGITETRGLRHGFRLAMKRRLNERVAFENLLWVRPFQDPATWRINGSDLNLSNDLRLIFSITNDLYFDYNFIFQQDLLWRTLSDLPERNYINSLNVRYDFNL